jgi:hypothetical protein
MFEDDGIFVRIFSALDLLPLTRIFMDQDSFGPGQMLIWKFF